MSRYLIAFLVGLLASPPLAGAWTRRLPNTGENGPSVLLPDGSVVVSGWLANARRPPRRPRVARIDRRGRVVWQRAVPTPSGFPFIAIVALAPTPAGDVVVVTSADEPSTSAGDYRTRFAASLLAGGSGTPKWVFAQATDGFQDAASVAADATRAIVAFGSFPQSTVTAVALADGSPEWQVPAPQDATAITVQLDPAGDAIISGYESPITKLAGDTGAVRWAVDAPFAFARRTLVLPDGDVAVASGLTLTRFAAPTGSVRWQVETIAFELTATPGLAVDGTGALYLAGQIGEPLDSHVAVTKVASADGTIIWQHVVDDIRANEFPDDTRPTAAVVVNGDVLVGSTLFTDRRCDDVGVIRLAGDSGTVKSIFTRDGRAAAQCCVDAPASGGEGGGACIPTERDRFTNLLTDGSRVYVVGRLLDAITGNPYFFYSSPVFVQSIGG